MFKFRLGINDIHRCYRSVRSNAILRNLFSTETTSLEAKISKILSDTFNTTKLVVLDTSGGCGAMFNITVESPLFKGLSLVKQHKMVTKALENEIKLIHGLTLHTKPSS